MSSNLKVNNILPSTGTTIAVSGIASITSSVSIASSCTASNFKTGTSNVHSTGYECTNVNATGVITATSFVGSGANLTGIDLSKQITIGVRSGAAVTFALTGSSFNVVGRSGNIPISI